MVSEDRRRGPRTAGEDGPEEDRPSGFEDLLAANETFAQRFTLGGFDGVAHRGVAMVTCMDSRIDPLGMLGLAPGDAKILRNLGGRVTDAALTALVLATQLLGVERVLVVGHTRCAAASHSEEELRDRVGRSAGEDATWLSFPVIRDPVATLRADVARVRSHPLIARRTLVGGFVYDVDTGRLRRVA